MSVPLVSIICCAYNHEPYIRQCLDGFIMQETNFPFEVLIHDDASTDRTADIIREYETKYPEIIKPIYQTENQYQKKTGILKTFQYPRVKGKYIAMCEGDDYWTDPLKLQKQVDFLETHPDYSMCSHAVSEYIQESDVINQNKVPANFTYDLDFLVYGGWAFQPLSVLYKLSCVDKNYSLYKYPKDMSLFYSLLKNGMGYFIADEMAIYRVHSHGVWSGITRENQFVSNFRNRLGIYDVEKSKHSAIFLLSLWDKAWGRSLMIKYSDIFIKLLVIFVKHFGCLFTLKLFLSKIIFQRTFTVEKHKIN